MKLLSAQVHCVRAERLCGASSTRYQKRAAVLAKGEGLPPTGRTDLHQSGGRDGKGSDSGSSMAANGVPNALLSHVPTAGLLERFHDRTALSCTTRSRVQAHRPNTVRSGTLSCACTCSEGLLASYHQAEPRESA